MKIKNYIDRFFKSNKMDSNYTLKTSEMIAIMEEMHFSDVNRLLYAITTLFRYGYAKGYRACKAEMKKGGSVA